jgi:hypothetical protein
MRLHDTEPKKFTLLEHTNLGKMLLLVRNDLMVLYMNISSVYGENSKEAKSTREAMKFVEEVRFDLDVRFFKENSNVELTESRYFCDLGGVLDADD